jgi:hypothetical protein
MVQYLVWPILRCRSVRPIFMAQIFLTCTLERWDFRLSPQSPPCISASLQTFALQPSTSSSTNSRQCSVLEERKKGRLVVAFWWVFVWILFKCYSTRPLPAMFLRAPPPWITNPTPHAAPRCSRDITGKKESGKLTTPVVSFAFFIRSNIQFTSMLCLTCHLLPRPPCTNYNLHALHRPLLRRQSNT